MRKQITTTKVWKGATQEVSVGVEHVLAITVPRGQYKDLVVTTNIEQPVLAPITVGQQLGNIEIRLGENIIANESLVSLQGVEPGSWWRNLWDQLLLWLGW